MPCKQARDAAAAADAEFCEYPLDMGADRRDLDLQPVRDVLVAEIIRYHSRDLEFAHRELEVRGAVGRNGPRSAGGADQRAGEGGFDQPQQLQRMAVEIVAPPAAPYPDVADIVAADVTVGIDAPMQAVAGEKIVEELGPHQIALRHHLRDQRRLAAGLKF